MGIHHTHQNQVWNGVAAVETHHHHHTPYGVWGVVWNVRGDLRGCGSEEPQ